MSSGDNSQGPGAGFNAMEQSQGMGGGYDNLTQSQTDSQHDMGGGQGIKGSGVAGGYTGSGGSQAQAGAQGAQAEKQDWLDKGISMAGKKFGVNVVRLSLPQWTSWHSSHTPQYAHEHPYAF